MDELTFNTALGFNAMYLNAQGKFNTALGATALHANQTGRHNTAVGYSALEKNQPIDSGESSSQSNDNSAFGVRALSENTTGSANTALGSNSLRSNTSGTYKVAVGVDVLSSMRTGEHNIAMGYDANHFNVNGSYNIAIGYNAQRYNASSRCNIAIGVEALVCHTSAVPILAYNEQGIPYEMLVKNPQYYEDGDMNVVIGFRAGTLGQSPLTDPFVGPRTQKEATWGKQNVWLGFYAGPASKTVNNSVAIGHGAIAGSNEVVLGTKQTERTKIYGELEVLDHSGTIVMRLSALLKRIENLESEVAKLKSKP
jgi:trimeric autotransporter adhesin